MEWTSYQFDVGTISPDSQGRVWMSCAGLCVNDGSTWKRYDSVRTGDFYGMTGDVAGANRLWSVYVMTGDIAGRLWLTEGTHFGVLEGTTWTGFSWEEFKARGAPVIDSRGDLWIASWDGLYRWHQFDLPTAIESSSMSGAPHSFHLEQNYPNPFNHATHIGFTLQ